MERSNLPPGRSVNAPAPPSTPLWKLIWRGLRLRCPKCGRGRMFYGWFAMHEDCDVCGRRFRRDPGYLLGSIYFNYGITASIMVAAYFTMYFTQVLSSRQSLTVLVIFCLLFPLWFFRYARSLWIAFDELFDPWPNEEERRH